MMSAASGVMLPRDKVIMTANDNPEEEILRLAEEGVEESVSDEVFSGYKFREIIPGCLPHPGDIVESGSLAAIEPPLITYPLSDSLPRSIVTGGKLSSLQLEGVVYACQRHQVILSNGQRAGFFLGDAAGVGKGRQISGILLDNFARGRTKHIWFSISSDLIVDARRDLSDIGCHINVIEGCQHLDKETRAFGLSSAVKEGVLFSTYATLVSSVTKGGHFISSKQSRLQQLVDWCGGKDFSGCLIFDECHKAKHFVPGNEQASSRVAVAVSSIQRLLPLARVVYCSATGVSGVRNMAFMERLGLWGEGAAFKSFEMFLETVHKKGLGLAEMLAMDMKSSGIYLSRSLSFKQAEFVTVEIPLNPDQIKMYNIAAHVWCELHKSLVVALTRTSSSNNRIWATYWAAHQRFFKQLCLGIKVDAVVSEAEKALSSNQAVVIGLQTTGEASLQNELNKNNNKNSETPAVFVSLCREILIRLIEQHFPTKYSEQADTDDEWCCKAKQMLLDYTQKIPLPNSSLDELIDRLGGPSCVAEMTGRRGRMVRPAPSQPPQYQLRDSSDPLGQSLDTLNVRERNAFMSGQKLIAIISDAASTGISLHADSRVSNQRRRVHLTVELPWSADKSVQQLGRSHRSNQSSGPLYKLMTTDLGGEKRFASAVAHRLQSLGALTKGDRRAASGADLAEFNFDTPYGRSALRQMYNAICQKSLVSGVQIERIVKNSMSREDFYALMLECLQSMDVVEGESLTTSLKVKDKEASDVGRFLNRILGLRVDQQTLIFTFFTECLSAQIAGAKREGRYNEGLVDIVAASVSLVGEPRPVFKSKANQLNPTKLVTLQVDRGLSWERAVARLESHPGPDNGFYCMRRDVRGKQLYVLATLKEGSGHLFKMARPNTGVSNFDEERSDLIHKYRKVSANDAEAGWREQYESSAQTCIHGPRCRMNAECTVGVRCYKMHLLCGGTMNLMSVLELTLMRNASKFKLTKAESTLRVVRVQLDNGSRVIGVRYPLVLVPAAEAAAAMAETSIVNFLQSTNATSLATGAIQQMTASSSSSSSHTTSSARTVLSSSSSLSSPQSTSSSRTVQPSSSSSGDKQTSSVWTLDPDLEALAANDKATLTAAAAVVVEPVPAVLPKLLHRATTAPPTIKSFFKVRTNDSVTPSEKSSSGGTGSQESVGKEKSSSGRTGSQESVGKSDASLKKTKKVISGDTLVDISNSSQGLGGTEKPKQTAAKDRKESATGQNLLAGDKAEPISNVSERDTNTDIDIKSKELSSLVASGGLKRKSNSTLSSNKVAKKDKTMSSFFTKATTTLISRPSTVCPICSFSFPATSNNIDVNKHIDNCVIE